MIKKLLACTLLLSSTPALISASEQLDWTAFSDRRVRIPALVEGVNPAKWIRSQDMEEVPVLAEGVNHARWFRSQKSEEASILAEDNGRPGGNRGGDASGGGRPGGNGGGNGGTGGRPGGNHGGGQGGQGQGQGQGPALLEEQNEFYFTSSKARGRGHKSEETPILAEGPRPHLFAKYKERKPTLLEDQSEFYFTSSKARGRGHKSVEAPVFVEGHRPPAPPLPLPDAPVFAEKSKEGQDDAYEDYYTLDEMLAYQPQPQPQPQNSKPKTNAAIKKKLKNARSLIESEETLVLAEGVNPASRLTNLKNEGVNHARWFRSQMNKEAPVLLEDQNEFYFTSSKARGRGHKSEEFPVLLQAQHNLRRFY